VSATRARDPSIRPAGNPGTSAVTLAKPVDSKWQKQWMDMQQKARITTLPQRLVFDVWIPVPWCQNYWIPVPWCQNYHNLKCMSYVALRGQRLRRGQKLSKKIQTEEEKSFIQAVLRFLAQEVSISGPINPGRGGGVAESPLDIPVY
jgi:hypothetical protein